MGTVGLGRVLELWLLGPDVVVEPGEKLADTKASDKKRKKRRRVSKAPFSAVGQTWLTSAATTIPQTQGQGPIHSNGRS